MKSHTVWSFVLSILLVPALSPGQDAIFSDDFEWGSICAWASLWYPDADADSFGDLAWPGVEVDCPPPYDMVPNNLDCDDQHCEIHPLAAEVCDGLDNDCDFSTTDGSEDPLIGIQCDGPDSDLCNEGTNLCLSGSIVCSDNTLDTLDVCDGIDNDCDPASTDGSEDPLVGAACDGPDSDLCLEGTYSCSAGSLLCSDNTGDNFEACNGIDDDCDGSVDEDFNRDDNPACLAGPVFLGSVSGDTGDDTLHAAFWNEEWYRFTITEDNLDSRYLSARIVLTSPPGVDFDLHVFCEDCGGSLAGSSVAAGLTGHQDVVVVRADEQPMVDDTFDVIVEVRHRSSNVCAIWSLDITGNVATTEATCD
jgi:hypothetical protein